ncbi:hypothetical protein L1276_001084 [Flavobacterium sp. HSC-32F16]|uniref:hypothetical protein n=1 Tax=Flavobacterium sp. HSC-32F16 TaxID=2910964 RepID=UPI0020A3ED8C|nr:hypothetical protein [Flavobacterium sp. HSC-32F16]MCP2025944.1 hypothetical protein [Flavobacterium sp. HSC-32F16]
MKKLYFLFIILISFNGFGQTLTGLTYTIEVQYNKSTGNCAYYSMPPQTTSSCDQNSYKLNMKNGSTTLFAEDMTSTAVTNKTYTIPAAISYDLSVSASCYCGGFNSCSILATQNILQKGYTYKGVTDLNRYGIESGITGNRAGGYSIGPETLICIGTVIVNNFKPNGLTISKVNPATPAEYIAGQQVDFFAVTPGPATNRFPNAAYHWQYSLDNKVTWIDVPESMNNRTNPSFTIKDLLGDNHVNHFGPIDFRLGYSNRPFTEAYRIIYKPGTVIVKDRKFENPTCYKDDVKNLTVYFDRKLESGEVLSILHIVPYPKPNPSTPMLVQPEVNALTFDPDTRWYKYSFNIPAGTNLENRYYVIEYQSKVNGEVKGTLDMGEPFLYENPQPVKFEIKKALDPLCHDDATEIAIRVEGGSGTYSFFVDGQEKIPVFADGLYYIKNVIPTAQNNIKVTDSKGCIEKNI